MHDHTSKGLKQLAVMKISNMILRYCMTNHYYMYFIKSLIFFWLIMKIAHPPYTPSGQGCRSPTPLSPVNPSLSSCKQTSLIPSLHTREKMMICSWLSTVLNNIVEPELACNQVWQCWTTLLTRLNNVASTTLLHPFSTASDFWPCRMNAL